MAAANTILNAYAPHLLDTLGQVAGANNPEFKISPVGFLKALLENNPKLKVIEQFSTHNKKGHQKRIFIKYQPRYTEDYVGTEDNCDIDLVPNWSIQELTNERFVKIGIHIADEEISKMADEQSNKSSAGTPPSDLMQEHIDVVLRVANGLLRKIDRQLLTDNVWGTNVVTGNNNAQTVNFNKDATKNDLLTGFNKLLYDASENEFMGNLIVVGSGLINAYEIQKMAAVAALNGVDVTKFTGYSFYNDTLAKTIWGTNQVGVFEKGAIGFVDVNKYVGFRAGARPNSYFFTLPLPMQVGNKIVPVTFDAQLKYIDCPTTLLDHYGEEQEFDRGWALFLSKRYGLWQHPSGVYQAGDPLAGVIGSLRYTITNECVTCEE